MENKDRITLVLSVAALLLSGGNIAYTIHKDAKEQTENVSCDVRRVMDSYETTIKPVADTGELLVRWQGVIANNGTVAVAIVDHRLLAVESGLVDYTGMDAGLFDPAGKPLAIPVNLAPGQAVPFILLTRVMLSKQINDKLAGLRVGTKPINSKDLMLRLGDEGVDFWGNTVKVNRYSKTDFSYQGPSLSDSLRDPAFRLSFTTARGNVVASQFSYYSVFRSGLQ
jgi:hypothetical protein